MRDALIALSLSLLIGAIPSLAEGHGGGSGPDVTQELRDFFLKSKPAQEQKVGTDRFNEWMSLSVSRLAVLLSTDTPCIQIDCEPFSEGQAKLLLQKALYQKNIENQFHYSAWANWTSSGALVVSVFNIVISLRNRKKLQKGSVQD